MNEAVDTYMQSIIKTTIEFANGLVAKQDLRPDLYTLDKHPQISGELMEFILTQVFPLDHIFNGKNTSVIYDINKKKEMRGKVSMSKVVFHDLALENLLRVHENLLGFLDQYCTSFDIEPTKENVMDILLDFRRYNAALVKGVRVLANPVYLETLNAFMWILSSLADWAGVEYLEPIDILTAASILCPSTVDPRKFVLDAIEEKESLEKLQEMKMEMYDIFVSNKLYMSDPALYKLAVITMNIISFEIPLLDLI